MFIIYILYFKSLSQGIKGFLLGPYSTKYFGIGPLRKHIGSKEPATTAVGEATRRQTVGYLSPMLTSALKAGNAPTIMILVEHQADGTMFMPPTAVFKLQMSEKNKTLKS